ncbi:hypothetical protein CP04DC42_1101B, partial [Chlamydia psittaci 04DC42]
WFLPQGHNNQNVHTFPLNKTSRWITGLPPY